MWKKCVRNAGNLGKINEWKISKNRIKIRQRHVYGYRKWQIKTCSRIACDVIWRKGMITYVSTDDFDFVNERRCAMQQHLRYPQSEIAGLGKIKKATPSRRLTRFSRNSHQRPFSCTHGRAFQRAQDNALTLARFNIVITTLQPITESSYFIRNFSLIFTCFFFFFRKDYAIILRRDKVPRVPV